MLFPPKFGRCFRNIRIFKSQQNSFEILRALSNFRIVAKLQLRGWVSKERLRLSTPSFEKSLLPYPNFYWRSQPTPSPSRHVRANHHLLSTLPLLTLRIRGLSSLSRDRLSSLRGFHRRSGVEKWHLRGIWHLPCEWDEELDLEVYWT